MMRSASNKQFQNRKMAMIYQAERKMESNIIERSKLETEIKSNNIEDTNNNIVNK